MRTIYLFILALLGVPLLTMANETNPMDGSFGIGQVAQNLMAPVSFLFDLIETGCFVIGAAFLFAALIKYFEHRRSPLMVPISTVIFLIIAGIILILLPFLSLFVDTGLINLWIK